MSALITPLRTQHDLADAAMLFRAYAASLDVDLGYQGFATELAGLPGAYKPPDGTLLLARDLRGTAVGCGALRRLGPDECEMKRLYVAPAARGTGLGRALMSALIGEARRMGYGGLLLDTLPSMAAAQAMYRAAGFVEVAPYYTGAVPGTVFLRLALERLA